MKILLLALALAACDKPDVEPNEPTPSELVFAKQAHYKWLAPLARDANGAVLTFECDSAHFSMLEAAVIGNVNVGSFVDGSGKFHRRPLNYEECYPNFSGSESAKEMYVYGALYAVAQKDLNFIQDRFDYGVKHQWVMGAGELSRTLLTPTGRAVLAQAVDVLGGPKHADRLLTPPRPPGLRGYQGFAQAVGIVFEGLRFGAITGASRDAIDGLAERNPRNAFYACLSARWSSGSLERAHNLLLDETIFPADRLPESKDYCESWITQRDDDDVSAWTPCPEEGHVHPAGAFLLAAAVCAGQI